MFCENCGTNLANDAQFCTGCGSRMQQPSKMVSPAPFNGSFGPPKNNNSDYGVMTVGQWIATILLCGIPIVNVILLFSWSFFGQPNQNKRNYARAMLTLVIIASMILMLLGFLGFNIFSV